MILKAFIVIVVSYFAVSAFAEYRVFNLRIEKIDNPEQFRETISNLDPQQYRGYYPVQHDERIYYTDTWMCKGRTGSFKKICDAPDRSPAALEDVEATATAPTSVEKNTTP